MPIDPNWTTLYTHVAFAEGHLKQMKGDASYASRELSLAFTALQEARHWIEEAPKPEGIVGKWDEPSNG